MIIGGIRSQGKPSITFSNRLQQIINGDTTTYTYEDINRLATLNGQSVYTFDNNGNLTHTGAMTNTFDAANRLIETIRLTDQTTNRLTPVVIVQR